MTVYSMVKNFKRRYPITLAYRLKQHAKVIQMHLNPGEELKYVFTGQKNNTAFEFPNTFIVALTNKRMVLGRKRMLFGYFFYAITPDLFNDLKVKAGIIWGQVIIDTVKEIVTMSNISRNALDEIETQVTEYMMKEKRKHVNNNNNCINRQ